MPRVKSSPVKLMTPSRWIFLVRDTPLEGISRSSDLACLRHPATGEAAMFLFSPKGDSVQELLTFSGRKRSWFIYDTVKQEGRLQLSTPFDPMFLVLPYLTKATATVPFDQLLHDNKYPQTSRLLKCSSLNLSQVADQKGDKELNAFKCNDEKVMLWLERKTERVAQVLKKKNVQVTGGSMSATFVKTNVGGPIPKELYLKYAHGIVSEYLSEELSKKLLEFLALPSDDAPSAPSGSKRKSTALSPPDQIDGKKIKTEASEDEDHKNIPVQHLTEEEEHVDTSGLCHGIGLLGNALIAGDKPPEKLSAKEKARQKAAQGSKSITSFFKKK